MNDRELLIAVEELESNMSKLMSELADLCDYYEQHGKIKESDLQGLRLTRDFVRSKSS